MRIVLPVASLVVMICLVVPSPALAQEQAAELKKIDGTLQQILSALVTRSDRDDLLEDKRLMLQRLEIQSARLAPIENERANLRLEVSEAERKLAEIQQKLEQIEDMRIESEFEELTINNAIKEYTRNFAELQASHNSLLTGLNRIENELATEREAYDNLAAAIDKKLGIAN